MIVDYFTDDTSDPKADTKEVFHDWLDNFDATNEKDAQIEQKTLTPRSGLVQRPRSPARGPTETVSEQLMIVTEANDIRSAQERAGSACIAWLASRALALS